MPCHRHKRVSILLGMLPEKAIFCLDSAHRAPLDLPVVIRSPEGRECALLRPSPGVDENLVHIVRDGVGSSATNLPGGPLLSYDVGEHRGGLRRKRGGKSSAYVQTSEDNLHTWVRKCFACHGVPLGPLTGYLKLQ